MNTTTSESVGLKGVERVFIIGLIVWILAQLIRLIAIPLIQSVGGGFDAAGWMYPAILDVVTAVLAVPLAIAVWRWRGFVVWTLTIVYFTISIVDHVGAFTNLTLIGEPEALKQFSGGGNPYTAPVVQTFFDIVFFYLLFLPKFRGLFFELKEA